MSFRPGSSDYARWRDRLAEGIDARFYPVEYCDWLVETGQARCMATENAAVVFELKLFPSGMRAVHGLVAAGSLKDIKNKLIPAAEQWGRANGAEVGMIESREGWARVLPDYAVFQTTLVKELF